MGAVGGLRVLIVEDEPLLALEYETLLEGLGHTPIGVAADSAAALALAKAHRPDVALVDLNLRDGLTGLQVAHDIMRDYATRVVFITSERQLARLDDPHVIGCLPKPFTSAMFKATMAFVTQVVRLDAAAGVWQSPPGLVVARQYRK